MIDTDAGLRADNRHCLHCIRCRSDFQTKFGGRNLLVKHLSKTLIHVLDTESGSNADYDCSGRSIRLVHHHAAE